MRRLVTVEKPQRLIVAALVGAIALCLATGALASRAPTKTERAKVVRVIRDELDSGSAAAVPIARIKIDGFRVSTANPRWAIVGVEAWSEDGQVLQPEAFVMLRGYLTGLWHVQSSGTSGIGCEAPKAVRLDLKLTGC